MKVFELKGWKARVVLIAALIQLVNIALVIPIAILLSIK